MVIGACVNGIGDETKHPPPPNRVLYKNNFSGKGWGLNCEYDAMKQNGTLWNNRMFPLYDGADFRRRCGTRIRRQKRLQRPEVLPANSSVIFQGRHNAFHFHNWFANIHTIRHKYGTYGHAHKDSSQKRVKDFHTDTAVMYQCALGRSESLPNQKYDYRRASDLIGDDYLEGSVPIYFQDPDYRKKRHDYLKYMIYWDETEGPGSGLTKEWDHLHTKQFDRMKTVLQRRKSLRGGSTNSSG
jgi:hypothetical protein